MEDQGWNMETYKAVSILYKIARESLLKDEDGFEKFWACIRGASALQEECPETTDEQNEI